MASDLKPLPRWRQWWAKGRNQRRELYSALRTAGRLGLTLAISVAGAILVSFGVWMIYAPAGFIVIGALLWAIQWNYGSKGSNE